MPLVFTILVWAMSSATRADSKVTEGVWNTPSFAPSSRMEPSSRLELASYPRPEPPLTLKSDTTPPPDDGALQLCVESADYVRQLVFKSYVGRSFRGDDELEGVTLDDDATVEANDQTTAKVTCVVTAHLDADSLIRRLKQGGESRKAKALKNMTRGAGAAVSTRVLYTVKRTGPQGQTYIELLRFR